MRLSAIGFLMILTTLFLSACEQQQTAMIEHRGTEYHGRNIASVAPVVTTPIVTTPVAPQKIVTASNYTSPSPFRYLHPEKVKTQMKAPTPTVTAKVETPKPIAAPVVESVVPIEPVTVAKAGNWQWPVDGKVTQNFGTQANGTASEGITIAAAEGTAIHAAQAGEVAFVGHNMRDYGNIVILRHPDKTLTSYAHAKDITVKKGDQIAAHGVLGTVGSSGSVKTPQLHFALREGDRAVDPLQKLPQHYASN